MAKCRKIEEAKNREEENSHDDEKLTSDEELMSEDESSSDDDKNICKEIEVNFEAMTPDDTDFHGIRRLLQQLFLKAHIDLSELSELIIKQNYVCSVVKQEINEEEDDDDDMEDEDFGMISVINITEKRDVNCISQIRSFLENHCKEAGSEGKKLLSILEDFTLQTGLILSERFMNIPPKLALPLYENLKLDMKKAVEKNMEFQFSFYLLISKIYQQKPGQKKQEENIIYANAEEEFFAEEAELQFDYSVASESDTGLGGAWSDCDDEWKPCRRILLLPASKLDNVIQKLQSEFS